MVFENVTLFEVHVDGGEFRSVFGDTEDDSVDADAVSEEMGGQDDAGVVESKPGAGRKRRYVAVLGLAAVGSVVARRYRRRRAKAAVDVTVDAPESDDQAVHEQTA